MEETIQQYLAEENETPREEFDYDRERTYDDYYRERGYEDSSRYPDRDRERRKERERRDRYRHDRSRSDRRRERSRSREREWRRSDSVAWDGGPGRWEDEKWSENRAYGRESYGRYYDEEYDYDRSTRYEESSGAQVYDYNHRSSSIGNDSGRSSPIYRRSPPGGRSEERGGEKWITETPTNTVMLKGLHVSITENDIRAELQIFGAPVREVRLMKRQNSGVSRGFAFVEFMQVEDARRWMEHNQKRLILAGNMAANMYYSTPRNAPVIDSRLDLWARADWVCNKCGAHNFKRRENCFKCHISRDESDRAKEGDGFDQVGINPCNTLIFRGLDALTNEEKLTMALTTLAAILPKNVKVIRDEETGTSRGYGYVEFNSIGESTQMLDLIRNLPNPLEIDGKAVLGDFAKNTFTTILATMNASLIAQQQANWSYTTDGHAQSGYYDPTGKWIAYNSQYYADYYAQYGYEPPAATLDNATIQSDNTNAAAAVALAAIQQTQMAKTYQKKHEEVQKQVVAQMHQQQKLVDMTPEERLVHEAQQWSQAAKPDDMEYFKYPVPDVSTYTYDESSGYYYDASTGLYYDSNTQYYYNPTAKVFMYWDGERETYLPAPTEENLLSANSAEPEKEDENSKKKTNEKKEKVKVAKKIAKDMEKWAKSLNQQKEMMKEIFKKHNLAVLTSPAQMQAVQQQQKESASADAGFAILEKKALVDVHRLDLAALREEKTIPMPIVKNNVNQAKDDSLGPLVASYGGDSDGETATAPTPLEQNEEDSEAKLVDQVKLACLLCKRQFPNKDVLNKHCTLSDLHKTNLEKHRQNTKNQTAQYRDRAKERRDKFGLSDPPRMRKKPEIVDIPIPYEQPTVKGIEADNVGNKLLQKMGWSTGQGLGKKGQGITDPVEAKTRAIGSGLGAPGADYDIRTNDNYKESAKKIMYARFKDINS